MTSLSVDGPRAIRGRIRVPGDKSISHRSLLLAALAEGTSTVRGLSTGEDVAATAAAMTAMGAVIDGERITGGLAALHEPESVIDVGNSGTGLRLLAGWCAARPWLTVLTGDASVRRRPMGRVAAPLRQMGAAVDGREAGSRAPLVVRGGGLTGIDHRMTVDSAQVKGAVLLAGLGAEGRTSVTERAPVRAHTEELLALAGADVEVDGRTVRVRRSVLRPFELDVPGDPSAAAFWIVAACVLPGSDVTVEGVYLGPARSGFVDVLRRMGADLDVDEATGDVRARSSDLRGTDIGGDEVPGLVDEVPVLAIAAACAQGDTTVSGAAELRVKESDRVATTIAMLAALRGVAEPKADGLVVHGGGPGSLRAGTVHACGDHRIAMAAAVGALAASGETTIEGWDSVATSYPAFEEVLAECTTARS